MYRADPKKVIDGFISGWVASGEATGAKPGEDGRPTLQQVTDGFPVYVAKKCGGKVTP